MRDIRTPVHLQTNINYSKQLIALCRIINTAAGSTDIRVRTSADAWSRAGIGWHVLYTNVTESSKFVCSSPKLDVARSVTSKEVQLPSRVSTGTGARSAELRHGAHSCPQIYGRCLDQREMLTQAARSAFLVWGYCLSFGFLALGSV